MNIGRRVCCHAANAFQPSSALLRVFAAPGGHRRPTLTTLKSAAVAVNARPRPLATQAEEDADGTYGEKPGFGVASPATASAAHHLLEQPPSAGTRDKVLGGPNERRVAGNVETQSPQEKGTSRKRGQSGERKEPPRAFIKSGRSKRKRSKERRPKDMGDHPPGAESVPTLDSGRSGLDKVSMATSSSSTSSKISKATKAEILRQNERPVEYEGVYVHPKARSGSPQELPWLSDLPHVITYDTLPKPQQRLIRIGAEIESFARWISLTATERTAHDAVVADTISTLQANVPSCKVEVFGSARTGFALASSDIDLRLYKDGLDSWEHLPSRQRRSRTSAALKDARRWFALDPGYSRCQLRHARYPLLHMQHRKTGIDVQLVCGKDMSRQQDRIRRYLQATPELLDIYAVLKTSLEVRGLTDVHRGGLGSYSLLIMIYAALKTLRQSESDRTAEPMSLRLENVEAERKYELLGTMLERVLQFYGEDLDTYNYALESEFSGPPRRKIDPAEAAADPSSSTSADAIFVKDRKEPYRLCLQDPNDRSNDLGRQVFGWKHIQATFAKLRQSLLVPEGEATKPSHLFHLVGAAIPFYRTRRVLADKYGLHILRQNQAKKQGNSEIALSATTPVQASVRQEEKGQPYKAASFASANGTVAHDVRLTGNTFRRLKLHGTNDDNCGSSQASRVRRVRTSQVQFVRIARFGLSGSGGEGHEKTALSSSMTNTEAIATDRERLEITATDELVRGAEPVAAEREY